jgi:uncharacterized membrane protein
MTTPRLPKTSPPRPVDDTGDGLLMFVVFTAAVLTSTGAVVLIALVGAWWMLGFGFAVHVIVTAVVLLTIAHAMAGRNRARAERERPSPAPDHRLEARPQAHARPVTAP